MPFLSIITINYNNADGLRKTLESVRTQSFTDYEHIIVDGGSTDGSVEVIQEFLQDAEYAKHVSWWCSEKDKGIYNAMNKGIQHAKGEYVATLNSGDSYVADALCGLQEVATRNAGAVLYGAISTFKNGEFAGTVCTPASKLNTGMIPHPASFVPYLLYKKYGLYDENFKSSGDWEFFLRLYCGKEKFVYINKIVADYDLSGISETQHKLVAAENKRLLMRHGFWHVSYKKRFVQLLRNVLSLLQRK